MNKVYFVFIGLLFTVGLGTVIYFGIQPRTIPKIQLSTFSGPGDMGIALTQRLQQEIKASRLLVLGVAPGDEKNGEALWRGFLRSLTDGGLPILHVLVDKTMVDADLGMKTEPIDFRDQLSPVAEGIRTLLKNERGWVVIVAPTFYTSQHLAASPAGRLDHEFHLDPLSLSAAPLPRNRDGENGYPIPCLTNDEGTGTGALGCLILQRARGLYRKIQPSEKYYGVADQVGLRDYMVLMLPPGGTRN